MALSLGHLASLYNYDMRRHDDALPLYLRSIEIALKMFGPAFSGLEYDYRGLIHLYDVTNQVGYTQGNGIYFFCCCTTVPVVTIQSLYPE